MVYNGSLPGPALHVYPGDRVEIDLINNLNESTNLHFHGLHVSPGNNSDGSERIMYFLMLLLVRHSTILSIFQKIIFQERIGIIHICINFLMDKFRQVCLACLLLKGLEKLLPEPLQNITPQTIAMRDFPFDNPFVTTESHNTV